MTRPAVSDTAQLLPVSNNGNRRTSLLFFSVPPPYFLTYNLGMNRPRSMTVLLALIILIKSLNCVVGESVFLGDEQLSFTGQVAAVLQPAKPIGPLHPGPTEQGCTDSGCLCKGFVGAPEVVVPKLTESLDDWSQLATALTQFSILSETATTRPQRLRPGDSLFADTFPSGRALRQQFASLTL